MSIWWTLHLRREAASVPLARRILLGTMDTAGVDPDISYELGVALSEACANAVEHAADGQDGGGDGVPDDGYLVTARIDGDRCRIEVRDSGPGFPEGGPHVPSLDHWPGAGHTNGTGLVLERSLDAASSAESGRGLYLIEALADHVQFRNHPPRGAVVSFDKTLKWRDGALLKAS
jgi:serine/threonine-protein kinase RsbW